MLATANAVAKDAIIETTIIMIATIINISGAIIFKSNLPVRHQALLKLVKPSLKKSKYPTLSPLFSFIIVIIKPYIIGISMTIAAIETKNPKKGIAESNPTKNEYPKNIKINPPSENTISLVLPKEVDENNKEIDPREELVNRLVEYKKFKTLAKDFASKQKLAAYNYFKGGDKAIISKVRKDVPREISDILNGVDMEMLFNAFEEVLKRQEVKVDKVRSKFNSVQREEFTIESKIKYINNLLELNKTVSFFNIFDYKASKGEIVATFLAILELIRSNGLKIKQTKQFGDIIMYYEEV